MNTWKLGVHEGYSLSLPQFFSSSQHVQWGFSQSDTDEPFCGPVFITVPGSCIYIYRVAGNSSHLLFYYFYLAPKRGSVLIQFRQILWEAFVKNRNGPAFIFELCHWYWYRVSHWKRIIKNGDLGCRWRITEWFPLTASVVR